ncbi:MAG: HIT family protein [Xanthomonadaceae bacterium]|nr:HIT family protein [Xanthomonadaceae bacterium]
MSETFALDPRLAADSVFVADGPLSQVRLMDDARFPWLLLVPRVPGAAEWIDLDGGQQRLLLAEINRVSHLLRAEPGVEKLNIAALGNIVRQLHVHLVGRHSADPAWPGPVWGNGTAVRHEAGALATLRERWRSQLG